MRSGRIWIAVFIGVLSIPSIAYTQSEPGEYVSDRHIDVSQGQTYSWKGVVFSWKEEEGATCTKHAQPHWYENRDPQNRRLRVRIENTTDEPRKVEFELWSHNRSDSSENTPKVHDSFVLKPGADQTYRGRYGCLNIYTEVLTGSVLVMEHNPCDSGEKKCGERCIDEGESCCGGRPGYKKCGELCIEDRGRCCDGEICRREQPRSKRGTGEPTNWGDWYTPWHHGPDVKARVRCRQKTSGEVEYQPEFKNVSGNEVSFKWYIYAGSWDPGEQRHSTITVGPGNRRRGSFQLVPNQESCFDGSVRISQYETERDENKDDVENRHGGSRDRPASSWRLVARAHPGIGISWRNQPGANSGIRKATLKLDNVSDSPQKIAVSKVELHCGDGSTDSAGSTSWIALDTGETTVLGSAYVTDCPADDGIESIEVETRTKGEEDNRSSPRGHSEQDAPKSDEPERSGEAGPEARQQTTQLHKEQEGEAEQRREWREEKSEQWEERAEEREHAQEEQEEAMGEYAQMVAGMDGTDASFDGGSALHTNLSVGGGVALAPLVKNETTTGPESSSQQTVGGSAYGLTADMRLAFWPIRGDGGGIAFVLEGQGGGLSNALGSSWIFGGRGGATVAAGLSAVKVLAVGRYGGRLGASTTDIYAAGEQTTGSGTLDYGYFRFGGGFRFVGGSSGSLWTIDLLYLRDWVGLGGADFDRGPSNPHVVGARYWNINGFYCGAFGSVSYPRAGTARYPLSDSFPKGGGGYLDLSCGRSFDWVSAH